MGNGPRRRDRTLLIVAAAWVAGAAYGYRVHRDHWPPYDAGVALYRWTLSRPGGPPRSAGEAPPRPGAPLTPEQQEKIAQLEALGYVVGMTPAPPGRGVTVHERGAPFEGVNLYSSQHGPEAVLIDMAGRVLHRWSCRFEDAFADSPAPKDSSGDGYYRRVYLFPDGDLLAIFEGLGIIRLDRTGALRWAVRNGAHHDVDVGPDGTIYVLTRRAHVVEAVHPTEPILEDEVEILTPGGRRLDRVSILDAVRSSDYSALMAGSPEVGDVFHTNSIQLLDGRLAGRLPAFARGHFLISIRNRDAIAVLDPARRKVVWVMRGLTIRQHDPSLLDNGNVLVFDNGDERGGSRVLEVDPATQRILWRYPEAASAELFSRRFGTAQRLPNGNTLMTFSDLGTALEVTPDRRVVWRFDSPHRTGVGNAFVTTLADVQRHRWDHVSSWLDAAS